MHRGGAYILGKTVPMMCMPISMIILLRLTVSFVEVFFFLDVIYPFIMRNYILDAPARSLVTCCVQFNAHSSYKK